MATTDVDQHLFRELSKRWQKRFSVSEPDWAEIALFRSLNVANAAASLPGGTEATIHDFGRGIALWVSAFEILVHPGPSGQANKARVLDLIALAPWRYRNLTELVHKVQMSRSSSRMVAAPGFLYDQLYRARNRFLHGEPVDWTDLHSSTGHPLLGVAPILFSMALRAFLGIGSSPEIPDDKREFSVEDLAEALCQSMEINEMPNLFGSAVLAVQQTPDQLEEERRSRRRRRR
ncbi:hypothetical protein ABFT80_06120 [Mesorhizobium sp. SB112]|uniref:hypothetical protein n=1 Tax=Mesorhizobium sp. SB112 TaxID=3151853 RepID=UPI0032631A54